MKAKPGKELFFFGGNPICEIRWTRSSKIFLTFEVAMARATGLDGQPVFCLDNEEREQILFTAEVRWNGCTNLQVGKNGYFHLCGLDDWDFVPDLFSRINEIRKKEIKCAV